MCLKHLFLCVGNHQMLVNRQTYLGWLIFRIKESLVTKENLADGDFPFRRVKLSDLVGG